MLAFAAHADALTVPARALFLGAQVHPKLLDWPELTGWQPLKPLADAWDHAGLPRADEPPDGTWPLVLVLPGKSRDEILAWFALARECLEPGGRIVVAMSNSTGAGRFEKEFFKAAGQVTSLQKNKCRVFHALENGCWDERVFQAWRALADLRKLPGTGFITQAGVFSSDHIDPGSQLLARHLPENFRGHVADLGAGWGYLSDEALRACPKIERLDLFEADARALACARINLAAHQRSIHYHWHDVTTGLPGTYDAILMNPPFHSGASTDVGLGRAFVHAAAAALRRGGKLIMVANRQLPYEADLDACGLAWRLTAQDPVYKIILATKH